VRTGDQLTLGERSADKMRSFMGSWGFVFGALLFLGGWMIGNGGHGFDPYPFILLNLVLSCLAAMQGAILLIAAKRSDQISAELAMHDYQTNVDADKVIKAVHRLTSEMHAHIMATDPATLTAAAPKPAAAPDRAAPGTKRPVPPARSPRTPKSPSQ
jgi:uncharacterized membrane protein